MTRRACRHFRLIISAAKASRIERPRHGLYYILFYFALISLRWCSIAFKMIAENVYFLFLVILLEHRVHFACQQFFPLLFLLHRRCLQQLFDIMMQFQDGRQFSSLR